MTPYRHIPSIEHLLQRPALASAAASHGRDVVTAAVRRAAADVRERLARDASTAAASSGHVHEAAAAAAAPDDATALWIETRALELVRAHAAPSLRRVINATGVLIHTNLGRAPLARAAAEQAARLAAGYTNLEYDLDAGARGHRHVHAERLLRDLTGAEAALVVNNAAAAALLALSALAAGREVIVSRGELVEIGGGFRVPEILAQSGAVLREVGTTNRTRISDYAAAINDRTALVLRVHPSNFHLEGFAERPAVGDVAAIAHRHRLPLVEDLGSGWLGAAEAPPVLADEPSVRASLTAGADLVVFSGDKLLGGPQAGIITGRAALVDRLRTHPLMRALRVDKLTYAALEGTLALWAEEPSRAQVPIAAMLNAGVEQIAARARALIASVGSPPGLKCALREGDSTIGGGSAPGSRLPTALIGIQQAGASADQLAARLRASEPPVIARIQDDEVVLDLRTVLPEDEAALAAALRELNNGNPA